MNAYPCPDCDNGAIVCVVPECCRRAEIDGNCGGRGCIGPIADEILEPCPRCRGTGEIEIGIEVS